MGQEVKQETRQEGGIITTGEQEEGHQLINGHAGFN